VTTFCKVWPSKATFTDFRTSRAELLAGIVAV